MLIGEIDHITITAASLAGGIEFVGNALGVTPVIGGEHPRMGTHNCLLKLGERLFLEVIAVNPAAPRPQRPRWFELDTLPPNALPRLATWVARTNDIDAAASASRALGSVEPMSRGPWNWRITIPADGSLPYQGVAPSLIQWDADAHPAGTLPELGCALVRLEGFHPDAGTIGDLLGAIGFQGPFSSTPLAPGRQPYLVAHIRTPAGMRRLGCA